MSEEDNISKISILTPRDVDLLREYKDKWYVFLEENCDVLLYNIGEVFTQHPFYQSMEDLKGWIDDICDPVRARAFQCDYDISMTGRCGYDMDEDLRDHHRLYYNIVNTYGSFETFKDTFLMSAMPRLAQKLEESRVLIVSNSNAIDYSEQPEV